MELGYTQEWLRECIHTPLIYEHDELLTAFPQENGISCTNAG